MTAAVDDSCVLIDGPWTHRFVSANGSRFHVVEAGAGPLVMFLHGFPEFWYALAQGAAGGGRGRLPCGRRGPTRLRRLRQAPARLRRLHHGCDATGLIRALGERSAVLVGSGYGGMMAWTAAAFHPRMVRRLVVAGAAHPLRLRAAVSLTPGAIRRGLPGLRFQIPRYEHVLTRNEASLVGEFLRRWAGPTWAASPELRDYEAKCRQAMRIPQASFCALEMYRWAFRFDPAPAGLPLRQADAAAAGHPHPAVARGAGHRGAAPHGARFGRYVIAEYEWRSADRGRPLPARGGARADGRRDPPLGQILIVPVPGPESRCVQADCGRSREKRSRLPHPSRYRAS